MSEHQSPELYVALGRLEEGMRSVRESQERMEKKLDAQDNRINEIELDVKELKTQRTNKSNNIAIWLAIAAIIVSLVTSFLP
jgi:septal ring factor EnvC (AmiA/AmiB activator)